MKLISNVLRCIINDNEYYCCLCLNLINEKGTICLEDEVLVDLNNSKIMLNMSEILQFVLGNELTNNMHRLNNICEHCVRTLIMCYTFIQTSQKNTEYLNNVLDGLTNAFNVKIKDFRDSKSLFLSFNKEDFTSKQFYDTSHLIHNPKVVLKKLRSIENAKRKIKVEPQDYVKKEKISKRRSKNPISTCSMLFDKNDLTLLKCKDCFKIYPTVWSLRNHFIRVHAPKTYKCKDCSRSYGSQSYLDAHRKESHCTLICSECGKTFYNRHSLNVHENAHYMSFICPDCGRVYKNKSTFKLHKDMNVCTQKTRADPSKAKFTCDYCNKKYTQKMSLRVHIQYEHGNYKAHMCEWCGKKFWAQSRLKAHIVKHTKEKNFGCNICGGKFVTKESLLYHTRIHTGEKPYECSQCNTTFLSASRRSAHIKRHHEGATLECDICHSKFNSQTYLQRHKRLHKIEVDCTEGNTEEVKIAYVINDRTSKKFQNNLSLQ